MYKKLTAIAAGLLISSTVVAADVDVTNAYARATAPGQMNSAAFMQLVNKGEATQVISASSPAAKVVELHTHQHDQGVMRMRKIDAIELPANATTELAPGGLHIMLIGLPEALQEGTSIELTLNFDDGDTRTLEVPVQQVMPAGMQHGKSQGHKHH